MKLNKERIRIITIFSTIDSFRLVCCYKNDDDDEQII